MQNDSLTVRASESCTDSERLIPTGRVHDIIHGLNDAFGHRDLGHSKI
jgi:hypothetical protein